MTLIERAKQLRAIIEQAVKSLDDGVALQGVELFETWNSTAPYVVGDRVRYENILYKCLTTHTAQTDWMPSTTPSLWAKVLIPDENTIPAWEQPDSTNPYMAGDKVTHNEKTWVSLVDNNVWEPGAIGTESLWQET